MRNAPSAIQHGAEFTETLEKWIKEGFVAGPFLSPLLPEFRANTIMAIEQKEKVRPVLNMSCPDGNSFNDNVDEQAVPKAVRLQGMQWLGAYFVNTQQIFGATPAVANYDNLGGTTLEVAISDCQIPRHLHSSPHPR